MLDATLDQAQPAALAVFILDALDGGKGGKRPDDIASRHSQQTPESGHSNNPRRKWRIITANVQIEVAHK